MTPQPSPPSEAFFGSAHSYLGSLPPEHRQIISVMLLRTLAAIRVASVDDPDLLRACARLEDKLNITLAHSASSLTPNRVVYDPV